MKRLFGIKLLSAILAAGIWTLGASNATVFAQQTEENTLRVAFPSFEREILNPGSDSGVAHANIHNPIFDSLLDIDGDGNIVAGLAEEWSLSPDGLVYTFKIRKDASFSGGWGPVTAEDVVFSLDRRELGPFATYGAFRNRVQEVKQLDTYTLTIRLDKPTISFIGLLAPIGNNSPTLTVSKKYLMDGMEEIDFSSLSEEEFEKEIDRQVALMNENPVGSGPFEFVSRTRGDSMLFKSRTDHWRKNPAFEYLEFVMVPEAATRLALLRSGAVDLIPIGGDDVASLEADGIPVVSIEGATSVGWLFNGVTRPPAKGKPTTNARVRQALNMAINRQELLDVFLASRGTMPDAPWGTTRATSGIDGKFWKAYYEENTPYDPEGARQILAEEGYPNGFSGISIHSFPRPNGPWLPQICEAVAGYWADIGVTADIVPLEFGAWRPHFVNAAEDDDFNAGDAAPLSTPANPDPARPLFSWYNTKGPIKLLGNARPDYDALEPLVNVEVDPVERARLVQEAYLIIQSEWTATPLFNADSVWAVNPEKVDPSSWRPTPGSESLGRIYEHLRSP